MKVNSMQVCHFPDINTMFVFFVVCAAECCSLVKGRIPSLHVPFELSKMGKQ
jgi:hypothetical protein